MSLGNKKANLDIMEQGFSGWHLQPQAFHITCFYKQPQNANLGLCKKKEFRLYHLKLFVL